MQLKLFDEAAEKEVEEARKAGALGYMARALVQATLPHSPVSGTEFVRKNGDFTLTMMSPSDVGLPFGSLPRLLLAWLTTEAVRTHQQELMLGNTLSEFMRELDLLPTGGRWGSITRLKSQMTRLFSSSISCIYRSGKHISIKNVQTISGSDLWWDPQNPQQCCIWESTVKLGYDFFNEIIKYPVPIDMRALRVIRQSPLAIDIYCWLTYRMSYLRKQTYIPWTSLVTQFGSNYKLLKNFKGAFLRQLKMVLKVYPECRVDIDGEGIVLVPSKTHVHKAV